MDSIARKFLIKQGYASIPHSLGHGIGIEVHEPPFISPGSGEKIENGMVFSVEPGIYFPGYGGVRIEDLVLIKNGKAILLTKSKRSLIEIKN
jgi:Xaa-Pro aminopeptidase